jgi:hypothetical protein
MHAWQGDRISMDRQLKNHQTTMSEINRMLGNNHNTTAEYLSKCIYSVAIGQVATTTLITTSCRSTTLPAAYTPNSNMPLFSLTNCLSN